MTTPLRMPEELRPGDVLLCYSDPATDLVARLIHGKTGSVFCHAGIYYGDGKAAESRAMNDWKKGQIDKTDLTILLGRYDHVAVIRQPDAWISPERVDALQDFIDRTVARGAGYNFGGAWDLDQRRDEHRDEVLNKLAAYHAGDLQPMSEHKSVYFCSEFVCDCFKAAGFLAPSAAVAYQSDTYSPADLGDDPSFGTFWGYLADDPNYAIPISDPYYHVTTFDELFGSPQD